ncbi:hypothetical protein BXZ70DRAFT_750567 [Cristinia sonorae]|uniref:Uncharacterized protein n=1 Tax=Cristinia sonorae TaxID=1940300 RepID=A0A8K0UCD9_9AGAR|nr:hypothetical protein BXZ70DRAFT_750567 [Cristinia sonorae]
MAAPGPSKSFSGDETFEQRRTSSSQGLSPGSPEGCLRDLEVVSGDSAYRLRPASSAESGEIASGLASCVRNVAGAVGGGGGTYEGPRLSVVPLLLSFTHLPLSPPLVVHSTLNDVEQRLLRRRAAALLPSSRSSSWSGWLLPPAASAGIPGPTTRLWTALWTTTVRTATVRTTSLWWSVPGSTSAPNCLCQEKQDGGGAAAGGCCACLAGMCLCCCAEEICCDCLF